MGGQQFCLLLVEVVGVVWRVEASFFSVPGVGGAGAWVCGCEGVRACASVCG